MTHPELRLAYEWTCDACGRDQFLRAVHLDTSQLSEEELRELRDDHGVEPWEPGRWLMRPDRVQCRFCGTEFAVDQSVE